MVVKVDNLEVVYPKSPSGPVEALAGISFEVDAGERVAVIGRSGSGKTTLMRVLSGLVKPTRGEVRVAGHSMDVDPRRAFYADVGLVFQDYGLVKQLTPMQNVLCGALHRYPASGGLASFEEDDRLEAQNYLEKLGLADRLHSRAGKLSGGEQQRVGIARLLMQRPRLMLLDEPVASLDVHWAKLALDSLAEVRSGDATAMVILHDLELARRWSTRVLLIQDGELIFDGDPEKGCSMLEAVEGDVVDRSVDEAEPSAAPDHDVKPDDEPGLGRGPFYGLILAALLGLYVWAVTGIGIEASKFFGGFGKAADFLGRMLPPDTSVVGTVGESIIETVQMALLGTTFAAILGLPLAMAAARNVAPAPVRAVARLILNLMRTVPSIIWGLFFVAIVGLGPLPGIMALTFYASGYLGKFYYEGIESIDPKPLTALKTAGASRLHIFRYGVFPQVLPLLTSYTLYMFEYNIRAASILGVVGAGGVGFYLYSYINNFTYEKATTALLMLLVLVTVIDAISSKVREKLEG